MTKRLTVHQPTYVEDPSPDTVDNRRVYDLLLVQNNVATIFDEIADKFFFDSFILEGIELKTGSANIIDHKLDRNIRGYWICKQNANSVIWHDESVSVDSTIQIILQCSADVTVDLIIY